MRLKKIALQGIAFIFEYETVKIVSIRSKKIGLVCRFIQLVIISYVIGYVIILKKGYQSTDSGISSVVSKVKGVSYTNSSYRPIWDVADYVVPPQEENAIFITTNALITQQQTQGKCAEDESIAGSKCKEDSDCVPFEPLLLGDGVKTGKCIDNNTCEVYAWCPVENSSNENLIKKPLLKNVFNFTIFIKNNIKFPKYNKATSNIPTYFNKSTLNSCRYNPTDETNKHCPIFIIGDLLNIANVKYNDIATLGGIIAFNINWDCNLDYDIKNCFPTYLFSRLDSESKSLSTGWNFRYANYYYINGTISRDLIKAYGIKIITFVTSKAGKFDFIVLSMNIGSGIALLGIATVICDILVLYLLKSRKKYAKAKYDLVSSDDAYHPFDSDSQKIEI